MHAAEEGEGGRDGVVMVVVEEEEGMVREETGRQGCCSAGGDTVKCREQKPASLCARGESIRSTRDWSHHCHDAPGHAYRSPASTCTCSLLYVYLSPFCCCIYRPRCCPMRGSATHIEG
jgi:hypothetical protein